MMMRSSFVDLLFILLCSTIVLLSQSMRVGAVDVKPAKAGAGGISDVEADQVRMLIVDDAELLLEGEAVASIAELRSQVTDEQVLLLVTRTEEVSHHRVMAVWSSLRDAGLRARLGVRPAATGSSDTEEGAR